MTWEGLCAADDIPPVCTHSAVNNSSLNFHPAQSEREYPEVPVYLCTNTHVHTQIHTHTTHQGHRRQSGWDGTGCSASFGSAPHLHTQRYNILLNHDVCTYKVPGFIALIWPHHCSCTSYSSAHTNKHAHEYTHNPLYRTVM